MEPAWKEGQGPGSLCTVLVASCSRGFHLLSTYYMLRTKCVFCFVSVFVFGPYWAMFRGNS